MRTLYTCLLLLFLTNTFGQITIDTTLQTQYTKAFNALPDWLQRKVTEAEKDTLFNGGFVISTEFRVDTLNKEDYEQSAVTIVITDVTTNRKKAKQKTKHTILENTSGYDLWFCGGQLSSDTLMITIGAPFSDETIQQKSSIAFVQSIYNETHGGDTIFWSDKSTVKTSDLTIAANTVKMIFSRADYASSDNLLYGYSEIETDPYYTETAGFKKGYIKKRIHFKYYFKCRPTKNST